MDRYRGIAALTVPMTLPSIRCSSNPGRKRVTVSAAMAAVAPAKRARDWRRIFVFKRMSGYNQKSDKDGNCEEMLRKGKERLSFTYKDLFQGLMQ